MVHNAVQRLRSIPGQGIWPILLLANQNWQGVDDEVALEPAFILH